MNAGCETDSERVCCTEDVCATPHASTPRATSQQSLFYTHRTAHGEHGLGDKTTLQELAQETIVELKRDFPDVFSEPTFPVEREDSLQHHICLKDPSKDPPRKKLYALDKVELEALKEQL